MLLSTVLSYHERLCSWALTSWNESEARSSWMQNAFWLVIPLVHQRSLDVIDWQWKLLKAWTEQEQNKLRKKKSYHLPNPVILRQSLTEWKMATQNIDPAAPANRAKATESAGNGSQDRHSVSKRCFTFMFHSSLSLRLLSLTLSLTTGPCGRGHLALALFTIIKIMSFYNSEKGQGQVTAAAQGAVV